MSIFVIRHRSLNRKNGSGLSALTTEREAGITDSNEPEKPPEIIELLEGIHEENERISELYAREKECVKALSKLLKDLMITLNTSLVLSKEVLERKGLDASQIYINGDSEVNIVLRDGQVKTMKLEEMSPASVLSILTALMPSLRKAIATNRTDIGDRVNIFDKIINELRRSISSS